MNKQMIVEVMSMAPNCSRWRGLNFVVLHICELEYSFSSHYCQVHSGQERWQGSNYGLHSLF